MKIKLKQLIALTAAFIVLLSVFSVAYAKTGYESIEDWEKLRDECGSITAYREVLESLPNEYKDYFGEYSFWVLDLDSDDIDEMIVATTSLEGSEQLLVYTYNNDDGAKLLFKTSPPVPIRYGFFKTAKGAPMYSIVTSTGTGDIEEGELSLAKNIKKLLYKKTNTYSMASGGGSKYKKRIEVDGYFGDEKYLDWGPLEYKQIVNHDFKLGVDNFSFGHNRNHEVSAFTDIDYREVTDEQYEDLTSGKGASHKALIDEYLKSGPGICYGTNTLMDIVKNGDMAASELEPDAKSTFELKKPNEDEKLYCSLNYLHAFQYDPEIEYDYSMDIGKIFRFGFKDDLKALVKSISPKKQQTFNYLMRDEGGHSILIIGLDYFKSLGVYRITLYDLNSISDDTREGYFSYMFINDDFSEFVLKDEGKLKTEDDLRGLFIQDMGQVIKLADKSLIIGGGDLDEGEKHDSAEDDESDEKTENTEDKDSTDDIATVSYSPSSADFKVVSDMGTLTVTDGIPTSNDFEVKSYASLLSGEGITNSGYICAQIPAAKSYTIESSGAVDIKLMTNAEYYTLKADKLTNAVLSDGSIDADGLNGSFEAGTLAKSGLVKLYGQADSDIKLTRQDDDLTFSSTGTTDVSSVEFYGDNTVKTYTDLGNQTELKLSQDNMNNTGLPVMLLVAIILAAAVILAVVILIIVKKRRAKN